MGIIIRQSIKGTIINYIGVAIGLITTFFVMTDYLTQEEIGLTRVLVDAAVLFSGLAQLGTTSSLMRFYPSFKDENAKDHGIFFWSLIIPFVGFIIFLVLFFLGKNWIIEKFSDNSQLFVNYFYFVIPIAFFMLYMSVFEINSNLLMRIAVPKFIREVAIRIMLLISYLLFGFHIISLDGLVVCFCVTYGIAALLNVFYLFTLKKISFKPDWKYLTKSLKREFFYYTLFLVTAALAGNITPTLNTFFVSAKMGLLYTGVFAIANYIATVIDIPYRSLGAITQPQIALAVRTNDIPLANKLCQKVSLHQFLAGAFIFLMIWINIDVIFLMISNGENYASGKWVVFILGLSRLFNSSFSIGNSILGYSKYYYYSLFFTFLLTFIAIFLNIKLIPIMGMNGAALATLISYVITITLTILLVYWKMKTSPFSLSQLKVLIIIVIALLLNIVWEHCLSGFIMKMPFSVFLNSIINAMLKTGIIAILTLLSVHYWHISDEVNLLAKTILRKVKIIR